MIFILDDNVELCKLKHLFRHLVWNHEQFLWTDESNHDPSAGHPVPEAKLFPDDELMNMIDPILENDDKNRDGFIDYAEFVQAQAAAASRSAAKHAA